MLAFTLGRTDFRENDQKIAFYTKDFGKIDVVARGIKKSESKNSSFLEPFSLVDVEIIHGKNLVYITKASVMESFLSLRSISAKTAIASHALSLVNQLTKSGVSDNNIFKLLYSYFRYLKSEKNFGVLLPTAFVLRLICFFGFSPILSKCARCQKKLNMKIFFSSDEGGAVCEECSKEISGDVRLISKNSLLTMRKLLTETWPSLGKVEVSLKEESEISECMYSFAEYHLNQEVAKPFVFNRLNA